MHQSKNNHFRYVPIQNILFDQGMTKKVNEVCSDRAKTMGIKLLKRDPLPIYKLEKVLLDFQEEKSLDPIHVKKFKETKYYEIIQGRTRVVASLHDGLTHVPVIII